MRRFVTSIPAILVLFTVATVLVAAPAAIKSIHGAQLAARIALAQNTLAHSDALDQISLERSAVHDAVMPSVVHIITIDGRRARQNPETYNLGIGASGAGWFWDDQGHIITNAHVVEVGDLVRVETFDGRVRRADVLYRDEQTDIAVLKINGFDGIQPLRRASGQEVRVGDVCFVFGSPFGIKFSMSQGTVSGLNRSQGASFMRLRSGYTNFIQTDAAMNPGNSGGPLINANGQVIGMNSAIANVAQASRNSEEFVGQSAGIGFAIPLETIENVVTQFVERRMPVVIRGYLGVNLQPASLTVRPSGDFEANGVYVTEVYPRSPADQGGVRAGDIIASANGQRIVDVAVLQSLVASLPPGQPVQLGVLRNGNEMTLEFNLGAAILDAFDNLNAIEGSESMTIDEIERIAREAIKPPRRR